VDINLLKVNIRRLKQMVIFWSGIKSFDIGLDKAILVGTVGATIIEVTSATTMPRVINQGHYKAENIKTY